MSSWACRCWKLHFCNLSLSHQSSLLCSTERTALTLFYTLGYSTEASLKKCISNSKLTKFCLLRPSFSPYFSEMSVARSNLNWQTFLSYFLWDDPPLTEADSQILYQPSASMSQADVLICTRCFPSICLLQNCVPLSLISGHNCSLRQKLWTHTADLYFNAVQLLAVAWVYSKVACLILPSATLKLTALRNL